ncbi:serine/threonine-protein phosphatase 2A regulatory subunit B'' subunit beta isoform X2 [Mesoplodon densirostris]|uniref:serine/threonine-protein phosphatase 2A regulatory subunit B'' subunit beta isoform X2 n=1 Tax=Mesoplodon densirostris TaxID=48708 RepID=UPI0028DAFBE3|nr:serine/threonine-protein phosphatase 2A regulatory subunit B'' subunit beta isoform X2 [Mesoplodon densirostris]
MPHQTSGPPRPPGRCLLTGPRARHARRAGRLHPGPPWGSSPLAAVAYYAEIHSGRTSVPAPGTCAGGRSPPGRRGRAPEMPPGKVLQPVLKMKVDELFMCWLSESSTQAVLQDCLQRIKMPGGPEGGGGDSGQPGPPFAAPALACRPRGLDSPGAPSPSSASTALPLGAASSARSGPPVRGPRRSAGTRVVQTRKEQPLPPAASLSIPTFYFPRGRPQDTVNVDASIAKIERTFAQFPHERATMGDMGRVAKACGCPLYWKGPLFCGAGGERTGSVSVHKFVAMWRKMLQSCHDDAAKFVHLLTSPGGNSLAQEDFVPFLQDVVNTHPGLAFLKEASEFHSRYITTVIQRIFYTVNRSWSGRITCAELRRSTFLQNVALLEDEVDINQLTEFFSYEHFYVIYCKFWELDTDHDLLIDAQDLARHNDHAISTKMIDRIFSGAVTRGKKVQKEGKISYADFVWFLISEEDKKTPTSIEYWFRCMDLDGDGVLSMFELEYFYEEQCRRLDSMAIEALPFEDCLCQMLDLVKPQSEGRITLHDLKRCKLASVFFDTFFNIEKYLDHEQREQISLFRDSESEGPELSDWERYAAEEYDILVAEEAVGEPWEDGYEAELSPVDQKLSALRSPLAQRPFFEVPTGLGAVELYEYERGGDDLPPS